MRVDRLLQFAVTLRRLRSAHLDHQPHFLEARANGVVQTEKPLDVEVALGVPGDLVERDSQLLGPDTPRHDLTRQQRRQVVLDGVRGLGLSTQGRRLVDLDAIFAQAHRAGNGVVTGGRGAEDDPRVGRVGGDGIAVGSDDGAQVAGRGCHSGNRRSSRGAWPRISSA
jgi:hypothetical protein